MDGQRGHGASVALLADDLERSAPACAGGARTQVQAGAKSLEEGARGAASGLSQTATGSAQALSQQTRSAVAGMAQIAAAARATATRLGAGASQQMATTAQTSSNLVLGNNLFDGITLKSIAMGAVGGAIGAGLTEALSAGAEALASSGSMLGRGATVVKAAMSEGEGAAAGARQTLGQTALKTGIGVTNDFVTNQATSLIFDHKLDLNVENIVVSLATNGVMSNAKVAKFQADVQAQIRSRVPARTIPSPNRAALLASSSPGATRVRRAARKTDCHPSRTRHES